MLYTIFHVNAKDMGTQDTQTGSGNREKKNTKTKLDWHYKTSNKETTEELSKEWTMETVVLQSMRQFARVELTGKMQELLQESKDGHKERTSREERLYAKRTEGFIHWTVTIS